MTDSTESPTFSERLSALRRNPDPSFIEDVDWTICYDDRGAPFICTDPNEPTLRMATARKVLRAIEREEKRRYEAASIKFDEPAPELIHVNFTRVVIPTAYGGFWVRYQYEDGTSSGSHFRCDPVPTYTKESLAAYGAWSERKQKANDHNRAVSQAATLLSGGARRCAAHCDGGSQDFSRRAGERDLPRSIREIRVKIKASKSNTVGYLAEFIHVAETLGLIAREGEAK